MVEGTICNRFICPLADISPSPLVLGLCLAGGTLARGQDHQGGGIHLGGITRPAGAPPLRGDGVGVGVLTIVTAPTRVHRDAAARGVDLPMATPLRTTDLAELMT